MLAKRQGGSINCYKHFGKQYGDSCKVEDAQTLISLIQLLSIMSIPYRNLLRETSITMFITELLEIEKNWKRFINQKIDT